MTTDNEKFNAEYYSDFWEKSVDLYESHPTGRHRRRFVRNALNNEKFNKTPFIFDYGCGAGSVLAEIQKIFDLPEDCFGGCDISKTAIEIVNGKFPGGQFYPSGFPEMEKAIDIAICSEVIEHTERYRDILTWLSNNIAPGGLLILTVPGTPMDPPDVSYGHVQHFELDELRDMLRDRGFELEIARRWGFPFFTLQKLVTRLFFKKIEAGVINTPMNTRKRTVFSIAYYLYFLHDLIPSGPQIFIKARKRRIS